MTVAADAWLDLMRQEYLSRFVPSGGAAVKFVVGEDDVLAHVGARLETMSGERRLQFVSVDAAATKIHMVQDLFFAIARQADWETLAQRWVEAVFRRNQYQWPRPGHPVPIRELSLANKQDETLLRRQVYEWLTTYIMQDKGMAQDFRSAMTHLCMRRMEMADARAAAPVIEWLRGELRAIGAVRQVPINAKITRHNGRAMLRSLCRWLRLSGGPGITMALDIRQIGRADASQEGQIRYSTAAVLDAFEVLRQLIDDAESFEGLFVTVLGGTAFAQDDPKRGVAAYTALKERIWAHVHAQGHENPLAPLLHLSLEDSSAPRPASAEMSEMPLSKERVAIEALRAGVPNRAAIRLLGTAEKDLCDRFADRLRRSSEALHGGQSVEGEIIAGGFGTGKSHLLGYLAELALKENFIVSPVAISKETPLFDPERLYAAAIRNAVIAGVNDDVMTAVVARLDSKACDDLERWATEAQLPLFAALSYLVPRQVIAPEDLATIARFLGGSKLSASKVRQWLRAAGAAELFDVKPVKAAPLALQRLRFAPRLFSAAGFSGWCMLIDEAELIGRYSVLQRGKSYAELCRWLGLAPDVGLPGVVGICAMTDDFKDVILDGRCDREKVPAVLDAKGLGPQARLAEIAMKAIGERQHFLASPNEERLRSSLGRVHALYGGAYGWEPGSSDVGERREGKTVRQFTKSWITDWDIQRIFGKKDEIRTATMSTDYSENKALEQAPPLETAEDDVS